MWVQSTIERTESAFFGKMFMSRPRGQKSSLIKIKKGQTRVFAQNKDKHVCRTPHCTCALSVSTLGSESLLNSQFFSQMQNPSQFMLQSSLSINSASNTILFNDSWFCVHLKIRSFSLELTQYIKFRLHRFGSFFFFPLFLLRINGRYGRWCKVPSKALRFESSQRF